jgi:3-isopropylmalate dehydrogenase
MILSVAMLVQWMGEHRQAPALFEAGAAIHAAVDRMLENPATRTADLGGTLGCKAFGEAVARAV